MLVYFKSETDTVDQHNVSRCCRQQSRVCSSASGSRIYGYINNNNYTYLMASSFLLLLFMLIHLMLVTVDGETKEDCSTNKREDRCTSIFEDKAKCMDVEYRPMLMDCLVTCGSCSAFSCSNPQPDDDLNCTALSDQCDSTTWSSFMKEKCPATCGKCDLKNGNLCHDVESGVICSSMMVSFS